MDDDRASAARHDFPVEHERGDRPTVSRENDSIPLERDTVQCLRALDLVEYMPLDDLVILWHTPGVAWEVEGTDGFAGWFAGLTVAKADAFYDEHLRELEEEGLI